MSFINKIIDNQRELNSKETVLIDDHGDEMIILKAKTNVLINELSEINSELEEVKKEIDNAS